MYDFRAGLECDLRYARKQLTRGDVDRALHAIDRALELIADDRESEIAASQPDTADAMAWAFSPSCDEDLDSLPF